MDRKGTSSSIASDTGQAETPGVLGQHRQLTLGAANSREMRPDATATAIVRIAGITWHGIPWGRVEWERGLVLEGHAGR